MTHDYNILTQPDEYSIGYAVAVLNLAGSLFFTAASLGYFAQAPLYEASEDLEYLVSLWGVRFPFAVGSACFAVGGSLMLPEALSDQ